jgi:uncharacterized NAD(P)/FAD-binding protein YdhS
MLEDSKLRHAARQDGVWILNAGRRAVRARNLVLATGNPPIASLNWPDNDVYINNFWHWRIAEGGSGQNWPPDGTVLIAGTGLSACDAVLSLLSDGYRGPILCVSPHGHMPHVHASPPSSVPDGQGIASDMRASSSARGHLEALRRHADRHKGQGSDWRETVDSLRPHLLDLWQGLDEPEKARFMRHLWSRWNIHRHRMAPAIADKIKRSGQVEVVAGRIVETDPSGMVAIRIRASGDIRRVKADKVLNCTGPSYRRMLDDNPLLSSLKGAGHIQAGPLGLGISVPDEGAGLYAMGTLLLGERLETTAVPELRVQAARIAEALTAKSKGARP